ncbi:AzlD domain-containing protein [Varunaivibrio sulfuroxidans]|uniref:Branched-subunit amino acid transport protein AzlD n=1 Tax=Varunaivibrio sulfuroxidans TaxID=1773489 RepID=A0A4R3JBZ7_9PROT|nr:AzlD domain-containing protein [Varunaivibrio sulfuroxidans]TCS63559.1 branched-subunit amino acid transport protein AzlD [Varunaivibrio sulfuroxidans]WES30296.1 AzlD domain-containing protein [Varunaivibrio sulfuroxidans]
MIALNDHWPWIVLACSALATYASRFLGAALSGRISPQSAAFAWVSCVTYALLAALIVRMILFPMGALASTGLGTRLGTAAIAFIVFAVSRGNLLLSLTIGVGVFVYVLW